MDILTEVLEDARDVIHRRHRRQLSCIAERVDTDDLYQTVCQRAWRFRSKCRGRTHEEIRHWVMKIAANECRNLLMRHLSAAKRTVRRHANRAPEVWEYFEEVDPPSRMMETEQFEAERRQAREVLKLVHPRKQQVLKLRYLEGWPYRRIATELGTSVERARGLACVGVKRMRELVSG